MMVIAKGRWNYRLMNETLNGWPWIKRRIKIRLAWNDFKLILQIYKQRNLVNGELMLVTLNSTWESDEGSVTIQEKNCLQLIKFWQKRI